MTEALSFITPLHIAMIPIVVGLTGLVKGFTKPRTSRYVPLVALAIAILLSVLIGGSLLTIVVSGLVVGLSACGAYSGTSAVKNG